MAKISWDHDLLTSPSDKWKVQWNNNDKYGRLVIRAGTLSANTTLVLGEVSNDMMKDMADTIYAMLALEHLAKSDEKGGE